MFSWTGGAGGTQSYAATFFEVLLWTLIWAFFATFTNYFLGMFVAMAINKKGIKFKKGWRTILVLTIAIPQFISLLYVSKMFAKNGIINGFLLDMGWISEAIDFFGDASRPWLARVTVILINIWIGIPYLMLITTGILMNIPADLYESAKIDGANFVQRFFRIVFPVTTPGIIASAILAFVGAWNEFLFAVILSVNRSKTLPVVIAGFITDRGLEWGPMAATAVITLLPILVVVWALQKNFVQGLAMGAVKG
jgi:arabinogalactan oligomer/maltooligosaccharide transport system permease protein